MVGVLRWHHHAALGMFPAMARLALISLFMLGGLTPAAADVTNDPAWPDYNRYCLACHGSQGDGRGPAAPWLWPRPRDFTTGQYKWRSTAVGNPPTKADIELAIRQGAPGTSMHGFAPVLSSEQVSQLAELVRQFAKAPWQFSAAKTIALPTENSASADKGAKLYATYGCNACHGESGAADGPAASALRDSQGRPAAPYSWQNYPLRRPRHDNTRQSKLRAIYQTLTTGIGSMPAYEGSLSPEQRVSLALFVESKMTKSQLSYRERVTLHKHSIDIDRANFRSFRQGKAVKGVVDFGMWPGHDPKESVVFGDVIKLQPSQKDPALSPAQRSLSAEQCSRCHAKQRREWDGSIHAWAMSPGFRAKLLMRQRKGQHATAENCMRCHGPLPEQQLRIRGAQGAPQKGYSQHLDYDKSLRDQGVTCAVCHIRGGKKYGPGQTSSSSLLALNNYPRQSLDIYERSDFCIGCHQLDPRGHVNRRPLLNTYREWLEGPYMKRGIQCQHCHMPNREHTWKGVHDPATFKQALSIVAHGRRSQDKKQVSARVRFYNSGAGHYVPTTPTPAAWFKVELLDKSQQAIAGASIEKRIGRHIEPSPRGWIEHEDTRIAPEEFVELAQGWRGGRVSEAAYIRVSVRVHPDDYYEGEYRRKLKTTLDSDVRRLFKQALARAEKNRYIALEYLYPVTDD